VRVPVTELESLRTRSSTVKDVTIDEGTPFIADTDARLLDVVLALSPCASGQLIVSVRGQPLVVDWEKGVLRFQNTDIDLGSVLDGDLSLRLLIDLTSVEVFINGGKLSACFCFLPGAYVHPLVLSARGATHQLSRVALFELRSSWNRG
ncbi:MAG: GH32 C-terminal domain-containing protein, partial [Pseudomonadota bacterium]